MEKNVCQCLCNFSCKIAISISSIGCPNSNMQDPSTENITGECSVSKPVYIWYRPKEQKLHALCKYLRKILGPQHPRTWANQTKTFQNEFKHLKTFSPIFSPFNSHPKFWKHSLKYQFKTKNILYISLIRSQPSKLLQRLFQNPTVSRKTEEISLSAYLTSLPAKLSLFKPGGVPFW